MGLSIDFIEYEIGRENVLNDNQLYLCGRQVPENWNEIKAAYLEVKINPSKYKTVKMEESKFKVGDEVRIINRKKKCIIDKIGHVSTGFIYALNGPRIYAWYNENQIEKYDKTQRIS